MNQEAERLRQTLEIIVNETKLLDGLEYCEASIHLQMLRASNIKINALCVNALEMFEHTTKPKQPETIEDTETIEFEGFEGEGDPCPNDEHDWFAFDSTDDGVRQACTRCGAFRNITPESRTPDLTQDEIDNLTR